MTSGKDRNEKAASRPPAPRWRPAIVLLLLPLPALAFLLLDEPAMRMRGRWPEVPVAFAQLTSDFVMLVPILSALALFTGIALTLHALRPAFKGLYAAAAVLVASGVTHALKPLIGRARPTIYDELGVFGRRAFDNSSDYVSFPSGHATHAGALFAALAFCFPKYRAVFLALALWFAFTRVLLGVHYPSDIAAGLLIGLGSALLTARLAARFGFVFRP